ncbi:MAG TPA: RNA polymerase sporulation sigma factor SigG [Candidatus Merdivicinus intestinigallinarum]|nr:RNA polymerase sporulation sigma factor SigG [Candidatus Merdivicinus intestinigallinarum]
MMNKVEICGIDTSRLPVLKEREKIALLERMKNGDPTARSQLINGNLRLVLSVVQRFTNRGENLDDLFQVGCIGLMKAIDHFDVSQGVKFSTYAVPMVIGEIRRHLRDFSPVRVSRSLKDTAYKAMQAKEKLTNRLGREPTIMEIAKEVQLPKENVVLALESIVDPVSLYEPVFSDGGDTICVMDQVSDRGGESGWIEELAIKDALAKLSDREKRIIALRFFQGKTQVEVSEEIGISQAQVSRLEKAALLKVKGEI